MDDRTGDARPSVGCVASPGEVGSAQQPSTALMRVASAIHSALCGDGATNWTTRVNALSVRHAAARCDVVKTQLAATLQSLVAGFDPNKP